MEDTLEKEPLKYCQLIFYKGAKAIQWGKSNLCDKWHVINTHIKKIFNLYPAPYTKKVLKM